MSGIVGGLVDIIAQVNTGEEILCELDCMITTGRILFSSFPTFSPKSIKNTSPLLTVQVR